MSTKLPARLRALGLGLGVSRSILHGTRATTTALATHIHTTAARSQRTRSPRRDPVPHVDKCPEPQCACEPAPGDLEIDRKGNLRGAFVPYAQHVLVCTGKDDWASRVEEEEGAAGDVVRGLKGVFGRGGKFCDPYHNVSVLASSFPSPGPDPAVYLLPSFKYIPSLPPTPSALADFAKGHLLPQDLHPMHDALPEEDRRRLTLDPSLAVATGAVPLDDVVVLICGHGGRDVRCGVMGPLLSSKFEEVLASDGVPAAEDAPGGRRAEGEVRSRVGRISHIGGHKFAGNVIVYVPPHMRLRGGEGKHPLAGCGVWYGRVEPRHVEGIVRETVWGGRVIGELFRGGIDSEGRMLDI
ncbi:related to sucrase/ferredoxin-like family protein Fmi1 [Cephalotrichum gorgonifer]|uniref:Altered inheritance of mitochondria protein 32 n=1 Tax=Cephalotrichum gorgonifer TaxID=2041049 RepID=A0AAE8MRL8_9PEZI|nr:related to sucrase/ferredoxin-like family protein Fmi1 [Cephalotrichum gorgonifer]